MLFFCFSWFLPNPVVMVLAYILTPWTTIAHPHTIQNLPALQLLWLSSSSSSPCVTCNTNNYPKVRYVYLHKVALWGSCESTTLPMPVPVWARFRYHTIVWACILYCICIYAFLYWSWTMDVSVTQGMCLFAQSSLAHFGMAILLSIGPRSIGIAQLLC